MGNPFYKKRTAFLISTALSSMVMNPSVYAAEPTPLEMHNLIVTSDPFGDRTVDDLINSVTVITDEELAHRQSTTLGETLDGLPGISNSDFGPGVGRPVVRGLTGSRVQILNNGLRVVDVAGEGADHNVAIGTSNASQVEIMRGPATLLYGGNASGGVINVISEHFNPNFSDETNVHGQFSYSGNGNQRLGNIGLSLPLSDNFVIRSDYAGQRSDDFDIDGFQGEDQTTGDKGTLENSGNDINSFSLTGLYSQDWGFAALGYSRWKTSYGIPTVITGVGEEEQAHIRADYERLDFRSEIDDPFAGIHTARFKVAYTEFYQAEVAAEFDGGLLEGSGVEGEFDKDETEVRIELLHNPIGAWDGVVGLQINDADFQTSAPEAGGHGGSFYVRDNETRSYGVFVLENTETSFGHVELAARIDYVDSEPATLDQERDVDFVAPFVGELMQTAKLGDRSFTPFSVSAGAIVDINDSHHFRVSLSRSERAPSPEQLYSFGEHHASETVEIGDPDLDEEAYTNLEIGLDRHHGDFTYNITAFYNQVSDYIYLETLTIGGAEVLSDEGNNFLTNEQEDAKFYGAEFTSAWHISEGNVPFKLRLSADYVRAKLDSGDDLPRISPARVGLGFDTGRGDLAFSMDYQRVFNQSKTANLESGTDGYDLLSFNANWSPNSLKGLGVFVKGRNLLNEDGRRHTSFLKDATTITGRSILAGVNFDFNL
ncbi:MAG: TonB-dependent receptor [Piscirickettsiaceae bacterium]|nr:TonB-dependent receptor [Piscirickettsiaceae bacterium]